MFFASHQPRHLERERRVWRSRAFYYLCLILFFASVVFMPHVQFYLFGPLPAPGVLAGAPHAQRH